MISQHDAKSLMLWAAQNLDGEELYEASVFVSHVLGSNVRARGKKWSDTDSRIATRLHNNPNMGPAKKYMEAIWQSQSQS